MSSALFKFAVIVLTLSVVGIGAHAISNAWNSGSSSGRGVPEEKVQKPGDREGVQVAEARVVFDAGHTVFVDSRSEAAYAGGHIPGALNIPGSQPVPRAKEVLADLPRDVPLITYCYGGGCKSSAGLANLLQETFGFRNVRVFHGGWPAWVEAGYPVKTGSYP